MSDFDEAVLEFIKEYPSTASLIQHGDGVYDPSTGSVASLPVETGVEGILMDLMLKANGLSVKYDTLVLAGDKEFFLRPPHKTYGWTTPVTIVPAVDKIKVGGITYTILVVKEYDPTGADPILYSLYLRR